MVGYKIDSPEEQTEPTFLNRERFFVRDQRPIPWDNDSIITSTNFKGPGLLRVHKNRADGLNVNGYNCSKNGFVPK